MLRYRLDDLGWHHFERLVQSLLKAEFGLAIESWGGHSDNGRDAYSVGPLRFPDRENLSDGPFIFQAKFVESANAAGAEPRKALLAAIHKEAERIEKRRATGKWKDPEHYLLLTNAPLHETIRTEITEIIHKALPQSSIFPRGGHDICDLLDSHKNVARSFPELLSLRDLNELLSSVVQRELLERSRAAIGEARDVASVFVATSAHHQACQILESHGFVVLDGPAEMGKSAIAWMISLAQLIQGWQAIDCRLPDDFFAGFDQERSQIFIVDDVFGRTEYDVALARRWERDLGKALRQLDDRHWMILTSRKHILARALQDLDLTGSARSFPEPGELVVNADQLSEEEKACILYRHARAAKLPQQLRNVIRMHARSIVQNENFTPERIRRLIREGLPQIASRSKDFSLPAISSAVAEAIRNPTKAMRISFRTLPEKHRLILYALLDCGRHVSVQSLHAALMRLREPINAPEIFELVEDLLNAFLRIRQWQAADSIRWHDTVDWIHPSYRDLVIDELSSDLAMQRRFLRTSSVNGITLALSTTGGATGERTLPFLTSRESWNDLRENALELANSPEEAIQLIDSLLDAIDHRNLPAEFRGKTKILLVEICAEAEVSWPEAGHGTTIDALLAYIKACKALGRTPTYPGIERAWRMYSHDLKRTLNRDIDDPQIVEDWVRIVELIESSVDKLSSDRKWQREYGDDLEQVVNTVTALLVENTDEDSNPTPLKPYVAQDLAAWLSTLLPGGGISKSDLLEISDRCTAYADRRQILASSPISNTTSSVAKPSNPIDIEALFADL